MDHPPSFFCVYEHWRSDKNECFYVGKGKWRRAFDLYTRNDRHKKINAKVKRLGGSIEVRLLSLYMTEDAAHSFEIERISYWRSLGIDLANICDGGEGRSGSIPSAETRAKMRAAKLDKKRDPESVRKAAEKMRGHRCYTAGKPLSDETKRKIGLTKLGNQCAKGRKRSEEHRAAISAFWKGRKRGEETRQNMIAAQRLRRMREQESVAP